MGRQSSEDKPSDVCQVSHTPGLYLRDGAGVRQRHEEPDTDQERRRDKCDPLENENEKKPP